MTVSTRAGDVVVENDEAPSKGRPDKIPQLKPAFAKDGTITAATSSSISDGAAALVLTRASVAEAKGLAPVARVVATAAHAHAPAEFTTAPIPAIQKVLARAGWSVEDVDLFEVNEAFACVAMFAMRDLGIPHEKINVNGGGTALGHPIGRERRAHHRDADRRAQGARAEARRRLAVHRRRGSYRRGSRAGLIVPGCGHPARSLPGGFALFALAWYGPRRGASTKRGNQS